VTEPLPFTGERFTPECVREIWYEHWHRYVFARRLARGKRVLDAACGEGYGSALLATQAVSVVGVDIDEASIAHAQTRYADQPRIRFERGDVTQLALPDASFDLIVSVETLEHVHEQERMLAGFARLLAPGGVVLISTPDRRTYSDVPGFHNEHHVRELYRDEFEALLAREFAAVRLYGQKLLFQSAIWRLDATLTQVQIDTATGHGDDVLSGARYAPLYYLAVCARDNAHLPPEDGGLASFFGDADETVYTHYQHEIRKNMAAGSILADMERRLGEAERRLHAAQSRSWWQRLLGR
jgi:SAM-dependent methyltransferase